jgi:DNA-binding MarR family transcriptional regulator
MPVVPKIVSRYTATGMGKGLSQLQRDILRVLDGFPSLEESPPGHFGRWARPTDIFDALGIERTASNRAVISRALDRLNQRGLIAKCSGEAASVGKSRRYARITDSANAGWNNGGPLVVMYRAPRMKVVSGR